MKKIIFLIFAIIMLISGSVILLYPTLSNWISVSFRELDIVYYNEEFEQMDPEYVDAELSKARTYNASLTGSNIEDPFIPGSGIILPDNYTSVLNIDDIIGYIEIPQIGVYLPIYHGTSDSVLQKGVGHMENTAFPIGGEGNHAVLTGHTGLLTAKLFTDLKEMKEGDIFYITVLGQKLAYQTDQILVAEPDETDLLRPVKGEDYVTLVTCTPYGINSHRLFVRGTRIPYEEAVANEQTGGTLRWSNWFVPIIVLCALITVVGIIIVMKRRRISSGQGDDK